MSALDRVFKAMREGVDYDTATISCECRISEVDAGRYLRMLSKSGVIECVQHDRYRKKRKYQTRQQSMF